MPAVRFTRPVPSEGEAKPPIELKVVASEGPEECSAADLNLDAVEDWSDEELSPQGSPNDGESTDATLTLTPQGVEDCAGATLELTVAVNGEGPDTADLQGTASL